MLYHCIAVNVGPWHVFVDLVVIIYRRRCIGIHFCAVIVLRYRQDEVT